MRIPLFQHCGRARALVTVIGVVFLLCSLTSLALASVRPEIAYTVRSHSDHNLYSINLRTGVTTMIGPTGYTDIEGLAFDARGVLYAYDSFKEMLLTCDPATGRCTPVGMTGLRVKDVGLAFDDEGNLIMSNDNPRVLYRINPRTAAAQAIGAQSQCICGLGFKDGVMYGLGGERSDNLVRIDAKTGTSAAIGPLRGISLADGGLDFDRNGVMWAVAEGGQLFTIDTGSGVGTQVGYIGQGFEGLAILPNRQPVTNSAAPSIRMLWPPDHGLVGIDVLGITDPDGDATTVTIDGITQDEPVDGINDGATCPDAAIAGSVAHLRAERRVDGPGRVYVVSFTATDDFGARRAGNVTVVVPRTWGGLTSIDDSAQMYNSLESCVPAMSGEPDGTNGKAPAATALRALASAGGAASLEYSLGADGVMELAVYDVMGRRVAVVENGARLAGTHRASWNTSGLPSGMYFAVLRTTDRVVRSPVVVLK